MKNRQKGRQLGAFLFLFSRDLPYSGWTLGGSWGPGSVASQRTADWGWSLLLRIPPWQWLMGTKCQRFWCSWVEAGVCLFLLCRHGRDIAHGIKQLCRAVGLRPVSKQGPPQQPSAHPWASHLEQFRSVSCIFHLLMYIRPMSTLHRWPQEGVCGAMGMRGSFTSDWLRRGRAEGAQTFYFLLSWEAKKETKSVHSTYSLRNYSPTS